MLLPIFLVIKDNDWINCNRTVLDEQVLKHRDKDVSNDEHREIHHFPIFVSLFVVSIEIRDPAVHPSHE
jgi:hypothetical protein